MMVEGSELATSSSIKDGPKLRITFVTPNDNLAGGTRMIATYAKKLMDRGHQVLVIHDAPYRFTLKDRLLRLFKKGPAIWRQPKDRGPGHLEQSGVPYYELKQGGVLSEDEVPDADVVIATWWVTAEWIAKLSPAKGVKANFIQGYELFDGVPIQRLKDTWKLPFHKITISDWLVNIAAKEYGDHDVSLVPNSLDLNHFLSKPRGKQKRPTVGLVYATTPMKGVDVALEAIRLAKIEVPDLQVHAFGMPDISPQHPLPEGGIYYKAPEQSKIPEIYASCDAWLFSSREEGFGLPIIEAMACRTPVIGFPSGAAPYFLAENRGILVKPNDPVDMAKAIVSICRMPDDEWRAMSELAYQKIKDYPLEAATDLFEKALWHAVEKAKTKTNHQ